MSALNDFTASFKLMDSSIDVSTGYGAIYSVANQVDCSVAINASNGQYTISAVTSDNASAVFKASYNGYELYKTFTILKSRPIGGVNKLTRLTTTHYYFPYDNQNNALAQTTTLSVVKQNISAQTVWYFRKLDNTVIASGSATALLAGGYITSTASENTITINSALFDSLCKTNGTTAIIFESQNSESGLIFSDRMTLYGMLQKSKVTWENINDPTGGKAQTVKNAYNSLALSAELDRQLEILNLGEIQAIAANWEKIYNLEEYANVEFVAQAVERQELRVAIEAVEGSNDAVVALVTTEQAARVAADLALATDLTELSAQVGTNAANITIANIARANGDEALAATVAILQTGVNNNAAANLVEQQVRSTADQAQATTTNALVARVNNVNGSGSTIESFYTQINNAVSNEAGARVAQDNALYADYDNRFAGVNFSLNASVTRLGNVEAKAVLSLNANGHIAGWVFANGGTGQAYFALQTDHFYLVDASGNGAIPFFVSGGQVYMQNAVIQNAAITNAKIDNLAVSTNNVQNNAITYTVGATTAGATGMSPTQNVYTTMQAIGMPTTGAPVCVSVSFVALSTTGSAQVLKYQIWRDGTLIYDSAATQAQSGYGYTQNATLVDYPPAGWTSYYLNFTHPTLSYSSGANVLNRTMVTTEMKK